VIVGAVVLGLLIGLSLGALGGGGSILTVPALVYLLGLSAQEATTASLVIVGVTAAVAAAGHARSGHTRWAGGGLLALLGVPASLLGSELNRHVDPDVLLLAFAALMLVAAAGMLMRARPVAADDRSPAPGPGSTLTTVRPARVATLRVLPLVAAGLVIGFLTGFLGVGGGFVVVPALVVLLRIPMPFAVGTSLLVISLNSVVALAARASHGTVVWRVILPFTVDAVAGSYAGKGAADRTDATTLTRAFAVLLVLVAAYTAVRAGTGLH
jgi:uncharacterized membrane protein YfcA